MFVRLLFDSLARQRRRKLLAVLAVWIGISLVVGLLALSLDVGDKMNRELRAFGANIRLEPVSAALPVRVGGYELTSAVTPAYLNETTLGALKTIFWANNILDVAPRVWATGRIADRPVTLLGTPFDHRPAHWALEGAWPVGPDECLLGAALARQGWFTVGQSVTVAGASGARMLRIRGIVRTGDGDERAMIAPLATVQMLGGLAGKISEADISALTTPENRLAEQYRLDPALLTPTEYDRWYCTPYPGSIARDIQSAIPGSVARVVRRVSESQGAVLTRINGLVMLLGFLAALACTLSVMGVLTSSVLERQTEVALLKAIGAHGGSVLQLFLTEAGLLGLIGGILAAGTGSLLGAWLVQMVFGGHIEPHGALFLLAPLMGFLAALAATALPIWSTLRRNTAAVLHGT